MFLKKITQKSGRTKLCVYESYREGARTRQRTVRAPVNYEHTARSDKIK